MTNKKSDDLREERQKKVNEMEGAYRRNDHRLELQENQAKANLNKGEFDRIKDKRDSEFTDYRNDRTRVWNSYDKSIAEAEANEEEEADEEEEY